MATFAVHQIIKVMLCPICKEPLAPARRQGVQIDYCRKCRGIWLDRGELDKIIAHSVRHFQEEEARTAETQALASSERQPVYPPVEARRRFMFEQFFDIE